MDKEFLILAKERRDRQPVDGGVPDRNTDRKPLPQPPAISGPPEP
jgi:hypothetical protein